MKQDEIDKVLIDFDRLGQERRAIATGDYGNHVYRITEKLAAALREENQKVVELVKVGEIHGWNGVENSKLLSVFFGQLITELKDALAIERARHEETKLALEKP